MLPAPRAFVVASVLLLAGAALAQVESPQPSDAVVTQQEQNRLRASAYKAERDGDYAAAAAAFGALVEAEPGRIDWVVAAGRCLGRSGRFGDAVELLDAGRKRFEGAIEIEAMLARTLLLQTEREAVIHPEILWTDAATIAEGVLATHPDHEDSRLMLAQARFLLGDWDEAQRQAEQAAERHPESPGARVLIGRIATERFRRLLQAFENVAPTGQLEGEMVGQIHAQRTRAREAYQKAAELDPTRAHPHVALSQLAALDGKRDEAVQHLERALTIDPDVRVDHEALTRDKTWQQRRDFYRGLRERFLATTGLADKLRRQKAATLHFHEGRAALQGLDFAAARSSFEKAIAGDPDAGNAHYYAFLTSYHLGDYDTAERHAAIYAQAGAAAFADVLRALAPEERVQIAAMVQFLGDRAYQQQRVDNSRDLNHVTACLKDSVDAWNNHAFLCRETGQFQRAYESYRHAIEKDPESAQLWNDAAVVLHYHLPTQDNLAKARGMYEKALQLAEQTLADAAASDRERKFAREARDNAKANLAELDGR